MKKSQKKCTVILNNSNRILLFNLSGRSGMLHYASQFANALVNYKKVMVILPSYAFSELYLDKINLIKIKADPSILHFFWQTFIPQTWIKISFNLKRVQAVHFLDNHPWMLILLPMARLLGKEIWVTQHDPSLHSGENKGLRRKIDALVNIFSRKFAHKIIIHSNVFLPVFSEKERKKVVVVPHGVYDQFGKCDFSTRNYKQVLFFGRIADYKGLDILLEAWKEIDDATLIVAGEGDLFKYKALLKQSNIEIINRYIDENEIAELFSRSSLLILPYKDATQSGPLTIAYSFEMPVIATKVGGFPDVVVDGQTGWLVAPNDVSALAKTIREALSSQQELKRRGGSAKKYSESELNWNNIVKKIYDIN